MAKARGSQRERVCCGGEVTAVPKKLWQCDTFAEQVAWCRAKLEEGKTLTDPGIWCGGADPDKIIKRSRA